jgi:hypothetical protein
MHLSNSTVLRQASPKILHKNRKEFLIWLAQKNPKLLKIALKNAEIQRAIAKKLGHVGHVEGVWETIADTVQKVAPALVQSKIQLDMYKINVKRAEQGLPPIDNTAITPTIKVQTELGPETRQELTKTAEKGLSKLITPALIVGGVFLFAMMSKK